MAEEFGDKPEYLAKGDRFQNYSIEIDCPPGFPRPGDLFPAVIANTGLKVEDFDNTGKLFGHWTWVLKEGDPTRDALYTRNRPLFEFRLVQMYEAGYARYVSW